MKSLSRSAQIYIVSSLLVGALLLVYALTQQKREHMPLLLFICACAALLQTLKITGATARTSYNLSWLLYSFVFVCFGAPATVMVILISHLAEWIWYHYPWYIQCFNIASFTIVVTIVGFVYGWLNPLWTPLTWYSVLALLLALILFTGLNHLLVGIVILLARGQSLVESGVFDVMTLCLDFGLLSLGVIAALLWFVNPYAIIFVVFLAYLFYSTLRVPALQRQAETDPKTGLFNTRYFTEKFTEELARAQRFGRPLILVMADLDLLREVNNRYGHLAGDVVLEGVAQILKNIGRDYSLAARFGGEEFAILMPETGLLEAQLFVEEMRAKIEASSFTVKTSPTPIKVTMSFGIAEGQESDKSIDDLIHRADVAVYQAKVNGRNRVCVFTAEQNGAGLANLAPPEKVAALPITGIPVSTPS